jgi:putative transposase
MARHDEFVIALVKIAILLIADAARFVMLSLRSRRSLTAEILFLRRQLALCKERGIKPRRIDPATRVSLAVLAKLCNWKP